MKDIITNISKQGMIVKNICQACGKSREPRKSDFDKEPEFLKISLIVNGGYPGEIKLCKDCLEEEQWTLTTQMP